MRFSSSYRFIFVRHLETKSSGKIIGQFDLEPSQKLPDSFTLPEFLKEVDFHFSSDLKRCRVLSEQLHPLLQKTIHYSKDLREIFRGDFEGLSWDEAKQKNPVAYETWMQDYYFAAPPKGETLEHFLQRIEKAMEWIFSFLQYNIVDEERKEEYTILVVTHSGFIKCLLHILFKIPIESCFSFELDFCASTTILQTANSFKLVSWNQSIVQ